MGQGPKALQHLLTRLFSRRALAVRRVTDNQGKWTLGADGEIWDTPQKKAQATQSLHQRVASHLSQASAQPWSDCSSAVSYPGAFERLEPCAVKGARTVLGSREPAMAPCYPTNGRLFTRM